MNTAKSDWQLGHRMRSVCEGEISSSPSQVLHLKCIIGVMKLLAIILSLAVSVQAQSLADAAKKERDRQANLKPVLVITSFGENIRSPETAAPSQEVPKTETSAPPDPVKAWNDKADQLRKKILSLQEQEPLLQLKQNDLTNQVYATVIDQTTKDQAVVQLGDVQQQLAALRSDLDTAKKTLDEMVLKGPPAPPKK